MEVPAPPAPTTVIVQNMPTPAGPKHLLFGRGQSFGGLVGLALYITSIFAWFYAWMVFTAFMIELIHTKNLKETFKKGLSMLFYPFVAIPMEIFYVLPYKYIYCPWSRYWNSHSVYGILADIVNGVIDVLSGVTEDVLDNVGLGGVVEAAEKTSAGVEKVYDTIINGLKDGANEIKNWITGTPNPPPQDPIQKAHEEEVAKQAALDLAVGKYCTTSTMPVSKGCVGRKGMSTSMFSPAHYFCDINRRQKDCTFNCQ